MNYKQALIQASKGYWVKEENSTLWLTMNKDGELVDRDGNLVLISYSLVSKGNFKVRKDFPSQRMLFRLAEKIYKVKGEKSKMTLGQIYHEVVSQAWSFRGKDSLVLAKKFLKNPEKIFA